MFDGPEQVHASRYRAASCRQNTHWRVSVTGVSVIGGFGCPGGRGDLGKD